MLRRNCGDEYCATGAYGGAHLDGWDSTGRRAAELDRFTTDDLVR